jgi:hypothetical protein
VAQGFAVAEVFGLDGMVAADPDVLGTGLGVVAATGMDGPAGMRDAFIRLLASVQYRIGLAPPVAGRTNIPVSAVNQGVSSGTVYCPTMLPSDFRKATMRRLLTS